MSEYKKLTKQPLIFALAELRYSPVLDIAKFIPQIQEELRKEYPTIGQLRDQSVQMQPNGMSVTESDRWAFISTDKKSMIDIGSNRLFYATAEYPRFENFSKNCENAITVMANIVDPALILRVGLRYGDSVQVNENENEKITDLVDPQFGVPSLVNSLGTNIQHSNNTIVQTDNGVLVIRTLYAMTNLTSLPDIQGLSIKIKSDEVPSERMILDFDHFWETKNESVKFQPDIVMSKLSALHETTRLAFWKVTTDHARNVKWA